jgi:hypothetical protein
MVGAFGMNAILVFLDVLASAVAPLAAVVTRPATQPESPVSFAEILAASAYLDFGGMPEGSWSRHLGHAPSGNDIVVNPADAEQKASSTWSCAEQTMRLASQDARALSLSIRSPYNKSIE